MASSCGNVCSSIKMEFGKTREVESGSDGTNDCRRGVVGVLGKVKVGDCALSVVESEIVSESGIIDVGRDRDDCDSSIGA